MIARLRGQLAGFGADHAILDVAGVGYLVSASTRTLSQLGALGDEVVLHTEMLVAEDSLRLVGFSSAAERDWFRLLVSVQGVGSRVALAILSALTIDELHRAISASDSAMVARSQGVGPKLALRIVNELRDKAGGIALGTGAAQPAKGSHAQDAVSALVNLGFRPAEAASAVSRAEAEQGPEATLDLLVRTALKLASRA